MEDVLHDSDVPAIFNETCEEELILRNIVDFSIAESSSSPEALISLESLDREKSQAKGVLLGTVIEPLPSELLSQLSEKLCCFVETPSDVLDEHLEQEMEELAQAVDSFDRAALKVGDVVDGYSRRAGSWLPATIVDADEAGLRVKLHFRGWKSRQDEWMERTSESITRSGCSRYMEHQARRSMTELVPYNHQTRLTQFITSHRLYNPHRRTCRVVVPIEDWCIDYSYANPSLWIISTNNHWYRLAGALGGSCFGQPSHAYLKIYRSIVDKYFYASSLAMCLFDILPLNAKSTYSTVIKEAQLRAPDFDESFVLSNYTFLVDQLKSLETQTPTNQPLPFSKTVFLTQLKTEGAAFCSNSATKKRKLEAMADEVNDVVLLNTLLGHKTLNKKIKFPIDDKVYWEFQRMKGAKVPPPPYPSMSRQLSSPKEVHSWLLSVWSILTNFSSYLGLPIIDVFEFENSAKTEHMCHSTLRRYFITLLGTILNERLPKKNISVVTNYAMLDEEVEWVNVNLFIDVFANSDGSELESLVSNFLQTGNAWVELLRILVSEKCKFLLHEYHDPLGECEFIANQLLHELDILYSKLNRKFRNADLKYNEISKASIGLSSIVSKIQSGFYDEDSGSKRNHFKKGHNVDVYSKRLGRWIEAQILDLDESSAVIHCYGWNESHDFTASIDYIANYKTHSKDKVYSAARLYFYIIDLACLCTATERSCRVFRSVGER